MAVCLNPFGCEPKTQDECIKQVEGTRTEAAARAAVTACRRLPLRTLDECKSLSRAWVQHLRSTNGTEWTWQARVGKQECRKNYPETFRVADWVTIEYCEANADRIKVAAQEIDPTTGRSKRIDKARRQYPELVELDDESAVNVMQQVFYNNLLPHEIAARVYLDSPPDALAVQQQCIKPRKR